MSAPSAPSPRTRRADEVLKRALELEEPERSRFLESSCADDRDLRRQVEALLAAAHRDDPLLRRGGAIGGGLVEAAAARTAPSGAGLVFGRYRTVRELGRGGMGVVYLAARIDGHFEQQVALKVIQLGATVQTLERFARERQILADLRHPNIARLLDGGVSDRGEPYLVMEPVDGLPIDRYCARHGLSVEQRLGLIVVVCRAVQAAHRRLVVHRDIKPSNVLVTADGEVKLLDFGIATLVAGDGAGTAPVTATAGCAMTPQYASPEQYRGDPITVASDVYQLGLLAYELLAGTRPYDVDAAAPGPAARQVCDEMPKPPSTVARTAIGARAGARARPPDRRLRGDLDTIVLKALQKDPDERYASADQLRQDIERHLASLPISARPPTIAYRVRTFVRRHTLAVGAAAGTAALIAAMVVFFTLRLVDERDRTRQEAERAARLQVASQEVADFLVEVFAIADPSSARGETITARELLDRGAARIEALDAQPEVKARLLHTIGTLYRRLGLYQDAEPAFRESLAIRETIAVEPEELAASLDGLATVLEPRGRHEEADALYRRALTLLEEHLGPEHGAVGRILHRLGALRRAQGRPAEAEPLLRRARAILDRGEGAPAELLNSLAVVLADRGRVEQAVALHERAIALAEAEVGADHHRLIAPLNGLASLHSSLGRHEVSLPLFERAQRIASAVYGPDHPENLRVLNNLGIDYLELGRLDEADAAFAQAEAIGDRSQGFDRAQLARIVVNRGNVALERRHHARAEALYRRGLTVIEAEYGPDHPQVGLALNNLGEAVAAQDRLAEAEPFFRRSLRIFEAALDKDHLVVSWPVLNLARLHERRREVEQAEPLFLRALAIRRRVLEPAAADRQEAEAAWAGFLRQLGRDDELAGGDAMPADAG